LTLCAACIPAGSKAAAASSTADHIEHDLHVATRRMRVGADFLVCFPHERGELGLSNALSSTRIFTEIPKPPASRPPIVTAHVTLAWDASLFFCLATKSSEPPKQAA